MRDKKNSSSAHNMGKHAHQEVEKTASMKQGSTMKQSGMKQSESYVKHPGSSPTQNISSMGVGVAKGGSLTAPRPKSTKKKALIIAGIVVALLLAVYGGGALFFSSHFFPNTVLTRLLIKSKNRQIPIRSQSKVKVFLIRLNRVKLQSVLILIKSPRTPQRHRILLFGQ